MTASRKIVLITGAAGNLGGKLRRHLDATGTHDVRAISKDTGGNASILAADLTRYDPSWVSQFAGVDTVVHLAADSNQFAEWEALLPLNIDMMLNVCRAAIANRVRRIVLGSSNWVVAGYRFTDGVLTPDITPFPTNAYGATKTFAERYGRHLSEQHGVSFICLRIGSCQASPGNRPGPHMDWGEWQQKMWLSDRDWCQAAEKAIEVRDVDYAILNVTSNNAGMRWDLSETRRVLGYEPEDSHTAIVTSKTRVRQFVRRLQSRFFGPGSRNAITDTW